MKRYNVLLGCVAGLMMVGCQSQTTEPQKVRSDVMDLNDSSAPPPVVTAPPPAEPVAPLPPPAPVEPRTHVVAAKDTLYALAVKYYGDAKQWPRIQQANPGLVPEKMPVGKKIIIP